MELPCALLSPSSKKMLKIHLEKFLIFQGMECSGSNIKKFLIFSQKKAFLIFREVERSYIPGNGNTEKILYISGNGTFLYFRRNFQGSKKPKIYYTPPKKVMNTFF